MLIKIDSKKNLLITSAISTLIFYLMAHGYRLCNPMFSGDSLLMVHQTDSAWQIALGRFIQPILVLLRGGIVSPFLISVISILFLSLSAFFLADFLEIDNTISLILITALMTCNTTLLAANSTFIAYSDFFTQALFFAVLGAWLMKKEKLVPLALGALSLSISLGIYQAYVCVAIGLVMIHFLLKMTTLPTFKDTAKSLLKYLSAFAASAVLYYGVWKLFQKIFDIWTANSYNGLASVGDYSDTSFFSVIATTYQQVFQYFFQPETFTTMPFHGISLSIFWVYLLRLCNIGIVLFLLVSLIKKGRESKLQLWHILAQIVILLLLPLGMNFVSVISKGMVHTLMIYAFGLVYILAIKLATFSGENITTFTKKQIPWAVTAILVITICWSNIVYSNQVYLKKDLQNESIHSLMTRIVYEIESMDGYEAGVTPVAISGTFENTPALGEMTAFQDILPYGMGNTPLTYIGTDYAYLTHILNVNMNLTRISNEHKTVCEMPVYPAEGSVAYVDGVLVVKVSE